MEIYNHLTPESLLSNDFVVSCKEKMTANLKPVISSKNQKSDKFQFDELILDQKDLNRVELILNNNDILITKDNYNFFNSISTKLNFTNFSNYLSQLDFETLNTSYELLMTLETFFMSLTEDTNFDIALKTISSIVLEIGALPFVNLLYSLCYTSTKDDLIHKIFEFVQKVSLTFPFIQIFNEDQERIALEKGQLIAYGSKPDFQFLSFCVNIPMNQRIMNEMNERKINYKLYRENYDFYSYLNDNTTVPTNDSFFSILYNDDVEKLQQLLTNSDDHYLNLEVKLHGEFDLFNYKMYLTDIAAYFGAIKCFKNLLLNHASVSENISYFAILGQNYEIIRICDQNNHFTDSTQNKFSLEAAFLVHNFELFQWLTENKNLFELSYFQKLFTRGIKTSNYRILDFIFKLCIDNKENLFNDRSLSAICEMRNSILIDWYIEKMGKLSDIQMQKCFLAASQSGDFDLINKIFDLGITKYELYKDITPLHFVTLNGSLEIIEKTLKLNRKVLNVSCMMEKQTYLTPLMLAFKKKRYDVAEFFLSQKDININAKGKMSNVFGDMDVYLYVVYLDDYQAFSMLLDRKVLSKLKINHEFDHEHWIKNSKNELIRKEAKRFH